MMLAANSYGIGTVWLNGLKKICDEAEIREKLDLYGVPKGHNVWCMLALGYPKEMPKTLAKKENVVKWVE